MEIRKIRNKEIRKIRDETKNSNTKNMLFPLFTLFS